MVVLNKIYTRTGDKGETALSNGTRVPKHDPRVEAYGTVDELNATIGLCRLYAQGEIAEKLFMIQNDLFDLGADLSRPGIAADNEADYPVLRIIQSQVDRLEREIDQMNADLRPLRSFILPGGSELASYLHLARTVARRAERRANELLDGGDVNEAATRYLNRLSDWFFVAARRTNGNGSEDVLWVPGANR